MSVLTGILIGLILAMLYRMFQQINFRPSMEWSPEANCDDPFKKEAYRRAGETLGVRVKFGPPTPCPGYSMCGGMTGIWLNREDVKKLQSRHEFTDAMWKHHTEITS